MKDILLVLSVTALAFLYSCGQEEKQQQYPYTPEYLEYTTETTLPMTSVVPETTALNPETPINLITTSVGSGIVSDVSTSDTSSSSLSEQSVTTVAVQTEVIKGVSADNYNAEDMAKYFKENNAPHFGEYVVRTTKDDSNLGKDDSYTSKVSFRVESVKYNKNDPYDGSVEVYRTLEDADEQYKYYRNMYRNKPIYSEYLFKKDRMLIRIKFDVDASDEEIYENLMTEFFEKLHSVICPQCGEIIPDDSIYCKFCGIRQ